MRKLFIFLIFFSLIFNQIISAQEENGKHPILTSNFSIGLGMYIPTQAVKFSVDVGTKDQGINFDETFDFNNNRVTPLASFDWRFSKKGKWKLGAEYFNAGYATQAVLKEDIIAGDYTFNSGSNVGVGYKINLYRIYVGRVISSGQKHELAGGLGFHVLNFKPYIEGNIIVNETENQFKRSSLSATAPLPNIAFWYYFAPTEKWAFTSKVDWFGITVGEYGGSLWDLSVGARYQIIKNIEVALDYRFFKVSVDVYKDYWTGGVDLSFSGPSITIFGNL